MATKPRVVNVYSAQPPPRRLTLLTTRSSILLTCAAIVLIGSSHLFNARGRHRCRLARALSAGEFRVFSHRAFHDSGQSAQPSCRDSLERLRSVGVTHLDLDLVLGPEPDDDEADRYRWVFDEDADNELLVAHPMEYKRESSYYSPCANQKFDDVVGYLKDVYGDEDWFISLEPKASWNNSPEELSDLALTSFPSDILQVLLDKVQEHNLKGHCAAIVEIKQDERFQRETDRQMSLLEEIRRHCQLYRGIRLQDGAPTTMDGYDVLMPTIEFHPSHPHNADHVSIPDDISRKSIFWVVDSEADLDRAAELRPYGIVSNTPGRIVDIIKSKSWCR